MNRDRREDFERRVRSLATQAQAGGICDVGGGAKPILGPDEVVELGIEYHVLDISEEELAKAPPGYRQILADAAAPGLDLGVRYNLVFSYNVAEHIETPETYFENCYRMLRPGGVALHYFPTYYYPWFVVNKLLPSWLAGGILRVLQPRRSAAGRYKKFPAYYRWCRGPSRRQMERFRSVGFEIELYRAYFGSSYLHRIPPLEGLEWLVARLLRRARVATLTSYALVVLRKPIDAGGTAPPLTSVA